MVRLSRLVVDLLDVSRIRAGKLELRPEACDLGELVRGVVREQRQLASGRVIRLRVSARAEAPLTVIADPDRIRQVATNFLADALKGERAERRTR
ncbi:MAG TPA: hypothetical protein VIC85_18540 [Ktedonobacterales bacterium]|jgi:signal transduction histidine kinase